MSELAKRLDSFSPEKRNLFLRALKQKAKVKSAEANTSQAAQEQIRPRDPGVVPPLSFGQKRLWFLDQLDPGRSTYNLFSAFELVGPLDVSVLEAALAEVVRRHEILRTTFSAGEGPGREPVQVITETAALDLPVIDLRALGASDLRQETLRVAQRVALEPYVLAAGPLARVSVLRLADRRHAMVLATHHIVSDDWSSSVFIRELAIIYHAYLNREPSPLPELPVQFADFACWQRELLRGERLERLLDYWRDRLAGAPQLLELPTDRPRPPVRGHRGGWVPIELERTVVAELKSWVQRRKTTAYITVLSAFEVLLARYTGQRDLVVGSPVTGHNRLELEGLVGFLINLVALRIDLGGRPSFGETVERVRDTVRGAFGHQEIPFEKLVEELEPERNPSQTPIFQVVFNFLGPSGERQALGSLVVRSLELRLPVALFDLVLTLREREHGVTGRMEYDAGLFEPSTVTRMAAHLKVLLAAALADPDRCIADLPLVSAAEKAQVVAEWNDTAVARPQPPMVHHLVTSQAELRPEALAVVFGAEHVTHGESERRANRLARLLRSAGVGRGRLVAVLLDRSAEMITAVLGILKSGGAYVPLETRNPWSRMRWILEEMGIEVVVTASSQVSKAEELAAAAAGVRHVVCLDGQPAPRPGGEPALWGRDDLARLPGEKPDCHGSIDDLAYVIFTSGSTGRPKGVIERHRPVVNLIRWGHESFSMNAADRVLFITSLGFDLSVYDIFGVLAAGGSIRVASGEELEDPRLLAGILIDEPITFWDSAPVALTQLTPLLRAFAGKAGTTDLRLVFLSGDWIPLPLPDQVRDCFPRAEVIALGGATEATVWSNSFPVRETDPVWKSIPYGRPIDNARYYVLDEALDPCPIGVPGDLYIGGECLSSGYAAAPVLTARQFLPDLWSASEGAVMYQTGDRARFFRDGNVEFLGRLDHQVKVRGFRIELGEIEATLNRYPGVRETVVLARGDSLGQRLVAYAVASPDSRPTIEELRSHLRDHLPEYMVPTAFVFLSRLPLTPNGKLDREALPEPEEEPESRPAVTMPRTPFEEILASIFAEVLRRSPAGVDESFFDLGGHSLQVAQLAARIRDVSGVELPLREVFEGPTVAELARVLTREIGRAGPSPPPLEPAGLDGAPRLSFAQQRLWVLDRLEPESAAYNIPLAIRLEGTLDVPVLAAALTEIVRRHEILRTTFGEIEGEPAQRIAAKAAVGLPVADLSALPAGRCAEEVERQIREEAGRLFDLSAGPMMRVALLLEEPRVHALLVTMHHIASDLWSMGLFREELTALYSATRSGRPSPLSELKIQYADFAEWQRAWLSGERLASELGYWREKLGFGSEGGSGPAVLDLPTDRPRPPVQTFRGGVATFTVATELTEAMRRLSRERGATLFMGLLGAFQALLYRYTGQGDFAVGTPVAGRHPHLELERLIGFFVNTLVLRTELSAATSGADLLDRAREVALEAFAHQDVPFEKLVGELVPERDLSRTPLFQVLFVFQNVPVGEVEEIPGLAFDLYSSTGTGAKFDLTLTLEESPAGLHGTAEYNQDLFTATTIRRLTGHFEHLLEALARDASLSVPELAMTTLAERAQLLEWNDSAAGYRTAESLPVLFEEQASKTADSVAVVFEDERLSYGALDRRANRLGHRLRRLGVGPETKVALCTERSCEMVVGLLGILKAGGAFVPLDPSYPRQRLAFMLADALGDMDSPVLVTHGQLADFRETTGTSGGPARPITRVDLIRDRTEIAAESAERLPDGPSADNLAYVIYTSGSTGRPKGAMNSHRGILNRLLWGQDYYGLSTRDRVVQKTPYSFDVSVWEFFWPLVTGAQLVLARPGGHRESEYLIDLVERHGISVMHFVPSMLRVFLEEPRLDRCGSLEQVVTSGEALDASLRDRFFRRFQAGLLNLYGPTESAIEVTYHACLTGAEQPSVPIGRPVANVEIYLLNRSHRPVPVGVPGELSIGGRGLARGYSRRPGLTAEKFVPDSCGGRRGDRLYRTGDLARWLPGGEVEFLRRMDFQIKIRGFRIELGEIEAALARHSEIRQVVVLARKDLPGEAALVAYAVAAARVDPEELRRFAGRSLPEYMVPRFFVGLPELPLLPNGKLDRRALPAPERAGATERAPVGPRNRKEAVLAGLWKELLRLDEVGVHDNFFELGGDSILSIQVVSRAARRGLGLSPRQMFENPTIAALASAARSLRGEAEAEKHDPVVSGPVPLTPIQHWFFEQDLVHPEHYNQSALFALREGLEASRLVRVAEKLLEHHDVLRSRFEAPSSETPSWTQTIREEVEAVPFVEVDLSALVPERRPAARSAAACQVQASLDLEGPLMRLALVRLGPESSDQLLVAIHHLVVDGVSWRILLEDLESLLSDPDLALPPKTTSYRRWAETLTEMASGPWTFGQAGYWSSRVVRESAPLRVDRRDGDHTVASIGSLTAALSPEETRQLLQEVPKAYRTQINDVLLAALAQALAGKTGHRRVLIDLEGHGRDAVGGEVDLSRTVGWFTSIFPVVLDLTSAKGPGEVLKSVKEELRAIPERGLSYGLLRYLAAGALPEPAPAGVLFNYLGQLDPTLSGSRWFEAVGDTAGALRHPGQPRTHLLEVSAAVVDSRLEVTWFYSENRHLRSTVDSLSQSFFAALRSLISHCLSPEAGGFTPSDFPLAGLDQRRLDRLVASSGTRIEDVFPVSPTQQGMLFQTLLATAPGIYVSQLSARLVRRLEEAAFEKAWDTVIDRHSILRTSFIRPRDRSWLQVVHSGASLAWDYRDWRSDSHAEQGKALVDYLREDRRRGFDLETPPLMRCALIRLDEESYQFVWSHHHVLLDGWSISRLFSELFRLYESFVAGSDVTPEPPRPYRDYIAWLADQDVAAMEVFWRRVLAGFTAPTPIGADPAAVSAESPASSAALQRTRGKRLSEAASEELRRFARGGRLTLNTLVQGTWALLLSRYSGESDVVFGVVSAGRSAPMEGLDTIIGLFINTLPSRVRISPKTPLVKWLGSLQEAQAEILQYEYAPLGEVQRWSEVPAGKPLFESILAFENYPVDETVQSHLGKSLGLEDTRFVEQTEYPLGISVVPGPELRLAVTYDSGRLDAAYAARLLEHLACALREMPGHAGSRVEALSLLSRCERHQILAEWNDTAKPCPQLPMVHERFAEHAARRPEAPAMVSPAGDCLTYGRLEQRANRLAHHLRALGVGPDVLVAMLTGRTFGRAVGILAVLKAGGAYVSIDPTHPPDRVAFLLEDARAPLILTEEPFRQVIPESQARVLCLDADWDTVDGDETRPPRHGLTPGNLAYVVYTSGSTGKPKGVAIPHAGLMNLVRWHQDLYGVGPEDRGTQVASPAFDASIWEFWPYLSAGAALHVPDEETRLSSSGMIRWWSEQGITLAYLMTPLAEGVLTEKIPHGLDLRVRRLIIGGDRLHRGPEPEVGFRLMNHYGPAEYSVTSTVVEVPPEGQGRGVPTIGRAIDNTEIYLLDREMRPVPVGIPGELYVAGIGLARGYLRRPALTAEKYLPHPFDSRSPGLRMYRTGDLVRWMGDGDMDFLGRLDHQVKLRGLRIELGEIESVLGEHPAVREAAVLVREDQPGAKRLVGYVVPRDVEPAHEELCGFLAGRLPEYMIPSATVCMASFPLTPNAKVDREALPKPDHDRDLDEGFVAPRNPAEDLMAAIWSDVLGVDLIGAHDDFFELGGHSLLANQVVTRVAEAFGTEVPLRQVFESPTLSAFAEAVEGARRHEVGATRPPLAAASRDRGVPLSFAQERLWFLAQLDSSSAAYNVPIALRMEGVLAVAALERAFEEIARRHEALRTVFDSVGSQPVQVVMPARPRPLPTVDLTAVPQADRDAEARRLLRDNAVRPFDLRRGPLVRELLLRLALDEHWLAVTIHHIVSDAASMEVLVLELRVLYKAFCERTVPVLPALEVQYADFAAWQRQWLSAGALEKQLDYWRKRLAPPAEGAVVLELPADRLRPAVQTFAGAVHDFQLPGGLTAALRRRSRAAEVTPFMTLLAAYQVLLGRLASQKDVAVGTPMSGRPHVLTEPLIGFFLNTLVMRTDLHGDPAFDEVLKSVRESSLEAYLHQDLPFEKLVAELQPERDLSHTPLFQVMFVFQTRASETLELGGLRLEPLETGTGTAKFDLTLFMSEGEDTLTGSWEYNRDLFDRSTIRRLTRQWKNLLRGVAADSSRRLSEFTLLTAAERQHVLLEWTDTGLSGPEACVDGLFEAAARRVPDSISLVFEGKAMSYAELFRETLRLAHVLRRQGVGPDVRVAISIPRSLEMVLAVLGTLRAGGVCLPLDPSYPAERLEFMIEDACAVVLLARRVAEGAFPDTRIPVLMVAASHRHSAGEQTAGELEMPRAVPESLAYLIYTSGSSGRPKAVAMVHRALANLIDWHVRVADARPRQRTLQLTSLNFDVSFQEILATLATGATLVLAEEDLRHDPARLAKFADRQGIERLFMPPLLLDQLAERSKFFPSGLREVIVAGEQLQLRGCTADFFEASGGAILHNHYGPSESHVVTAFTLSGSPRSWPRIPPIGRAVANTRALIFDASLSPVPFGGAGELLLAGACLARGYLDRPALTARKFLPDPTFAEPGRRAYRTGDLVRHTASGQLLFLGRIDHQIKLRGFRIELGEIESVLKRHPDVLDAVAVMHRAEADRRLVAYVVESRACRAELGEFLRKRLPDYMVPKDFIVLEALPTTLTGKIDRRALPAPQRRSGSKESHVPPRTTMEQVLTEIFSEVLEVDPVGVEDSFFDLGGHSLLVIRVTSMLEDVLDLEVPVSLVFERPTVGKLARELEGMLTRDDLEALAAIFNEIGELSEQEVEDQLIEDPVERSTV